MPAHKRSRKRDAILACVRSTTAHPTADWVYARLKPEIPDLSLGTVYRNLAMFKREGLITRWASWTVWSASISTSRPRAFCLRTVSRRHRRRPLSA